MTPPQTAPARMDDETFRWVDSPMADFSPDGFAGQYDLLRAEARRARDSEAALLEKVADRDLVAKMATEFGARMNRAEADLAAEKKRADDAEARAEKAMELLKSAQSCMPDGDATRRALEDDGTELRAMLYGVAMHLVDAKAALRGDVSPDTDLPPLDRCPMGEDAACQDCTLRPECGVPQGSTKPVEMEKGKKR